MEKSESQTYRDHLAAEIKSAPKELRRGILEAAKNSEEYILALLEHSRPSRDKRLEAKVRRDKEREPQLEFNLEDLEDLKKKLTVAAGYIYSTITAYDRRGGYDPHKGHMLCGQITDKLIEYLKSRGVESRRVGRTYRIKRPDGTYDDSFGHVYLTIDREEDHTLVDPTYLQWVEHEKLRRDLPLVLVIRYRDMEDFRRQFRTVPIKHKMVLPFYLGFDSEEARDFFKDSRYTIESEEVARIDD